MIKSLRRFGGGFQFETHTSTRPPPLCSLSLNAFSPPTPDPTTQLPAGEKADRAGKPTAARSSWR